jgi:hypothetical protein
MSLPKELEDLVADLEGGGATGLRIKEPGESGPRTILLSAVTARYVVRATHMTEDDGTSTWMEVDSYPISEIRRISGAGQCRVDRNRRSNDPDRGPDSEGAAVRLTRSVTASRASV